MPSENERHLVNVDCNSVEKCKVCNNRLICFMNTRDYEGLFLRVGCFECDAYKEYDVVTPCCFDRIDNIVKEIVAKWNLSNAMDKFTNKEGVSDE